MFGTYGASTNMNEAGRARIRWLLAIAVQLPPKDRVREEVFYMVLNKRARKYERPKTVDG
jgi:hypothetical protein